MVAILGALILRDALNLAGGYLLIREPGEIQRILANWRWAGAAGFTGALASICWFTAFTVQNASYVRALGQIELVFTFFATTIFFREKVTPVELIGIFLVCAGILILLLLGLPPRNNSPTLGFASSSSPVPAIANCPETRT
ncbi:MAG: EamA family transporter [Gammaproteobacteria bacterium]